MPHGDHRTLGELMRASMLDGRSRAGFHIYGGARGPDAKANFDEIGEAELFGDAAILATALRERGVLAGDYCLIACTSLQMTISSFFAAVALGTVPMIQPEAHALGGDQSLATRMNALCGRLGDRTWILMQVNDTTETLGGLGRTDGIIPLHSSGPAANAALPPDEFHVAHLEDVAFLQAASGTTGTGNLVAVPHRAVFAQAEAIMHAGWGAHDVISNWAPLNHDLGLVGGVLCPLCAGARSVMIKPAQFLLSPINWFQALSAFGVTFITMPDFGYAYCADYADRRSIPADLDLSSVETAVITAEPVRERSLRGFARAFADNGFDPTSFSAAYGMAETGLAASVFPRREALRFVQLERGSAKAGQTARILAQASFDGSGAESAPTCEDALTVYSNGRPLPGVEVRALDDRGNPVAEGVFGELVVSGPIAALGYVQDGQGAVETFEDGRVRTGDLGFLLDGEVYVIDRMKNVIIRHGGNHSASEIEQRLGTVSGIPDSRIMVLESDIYDADAPVVSLMEVRKSSVDSVLESVSKVLTKTDVPVDEVWFVRAGSIPKTTSGKKRYEAAREAVRSGSLEILKRHLLHDGTRPAAPQSGGTEARGRAGIQAAVADIVATVARRPIEAVEIRADTRLRDELGLDSLQVFEVGLTVQEQFGIVLREEDLVDLGAIGRLVDRVAALLANDERAQGDEGEGIGLQMIEAALVDRVPQLFNSVTKQMGRRVWIGKKEAVDFASCNYLGLDLHPEVMAAIPPLIEAWGVHPSWTRAVASPLPYRQLEERLSDLLDSVPVTAFATVTLLHMGVLPELAGRDGLILIDQQAHTSIREACDLARGKGTRVEFWPHNDLDTLESKLRGAASASRRVIAVDGVYSMTGTLAPLRALRDLAERYDAIVYVDDAHGFGVLGETPDDLAPYGRRGNGIVKYSGLSLQDDRLVYIAGLSKAYSSMGAFVAGADPRLKRLAETSTAFVFSGPVPVASLASALAGLEISEREGDRLRMRLADLTRRCVDGVQAAGFAVQDGAPGCRFPIVQVHFDGTMGGVIQACQRLWEQTPAVLLTPAVYPSVPLGQAGVRLQITAGHTDADIEDTIAALAAVA